MDDWNLNSTTLDETCKISRIQLPTSNPPWTMTGEAYQTSPSGYLWQKSHKNQPSKVQHFPKLYFSIYLEQFTMLPRILTQTKTTPSSKAVNCCQANGSSSDVYLMPVKLYPDPLDIGDTLLVLCETYNYNIRKACLEIMKKAKLLKKVLKMREGSKGSDDTVR